MFTALRTPTASGGTPQPVEFTVRGPLAATWGTDEDHRSRPGSCILDLVFAAPTKVGELVFRNYYTAWISVLVRVAPTPVLSNPLTQNNPGTNKTSNTATRANNSRVDSEPNLGTWKLAIPRRILMPHPHQETGSHDVVSIAATEVRLRDSNESMIEWNNLQGMRLLLQQPSPVWRTFHVEELNVLRELPRRIRATTNQQANVSSSAANTGVTATPQPEESAISALKSRTSTALKKTNLPEREGPPPKDFVGLVGYEVQGLLLL